MQAKLLRVIQEREFMRLGGTETIKVDVRIVAATNRNFDQLLKEGKFREDLYYRLNVIPITCPPLRERGEDIEILAPDQIQQQVQRTFESVEKDFQRIRRNVQIHRHAGVRPALHHGKRHFGLLHDRCRMIDG